MNPIGSILTRFFAFGILSGTALAVTPAADGGAVQRWEATIEFAEALDAVVVDTAISSSLRRGASELRSLSPAQVQRLFRSGVDLSTLQKTTALLKMSAAGGRAKDIEFPVPDIQPPSCSTMDPPTALGLLATKTSAEEIIAAVKWQCEQTELGENAALACLGPELIANAAKAAFEGAEFCLGEHRAATGEAILETSRNIGEHLNENVDAATSSRATQDSVDNLQEAADSALTRLSALQSDLDAEFPAVNSQLGTISARLDALETTANGVTAQVQDLQFRTQTSQVDIEDVQIRSADLQQRASEIRGSVLGLQQSVAALSDRQTAFEARIDAVLRQATRDRIAEVLGNPNALVVRYQLPASAGGELEEVREVVVKAIQAVQSTGGNTAAASALLGQGNQAFGQGSFAAAYGYYAQAYRALGGGVTP